MTGSTSLLPGGMSPTARSPRYVCSRSSVTLAVEKVRWVTGVGSTSITLLA
jgi:hypothetical protein